MVSLPETARQVSSESQSEAPGVPPQAFESWRDNRALGATGQSFNRAGDVPYRNDVRLSFDLRPSGGRGTQWGLACSGGRLPSDAFDHSAGRDAGVLFLPR